MRVGKSKHAWVGLLVAAGALAATGVAGAGELLVANKSDDTVWRLSLEDGRKLGEIATAPGPHEIAVSPDGRLAAVTGYGRADEPTEPDRRPRHALTLIDTTSGSEAGTIVLGPRDRRPHGAGFTPDGRRLRVTAEGGGSLLEIDWEQARAGHGRAIRRTDIGLGIGHMVALSTDGRIAYVSKIAAGSVVRVDLSTESVLERPAGGGAEGIGIAPDGTVWVTNREDGTVTVHDPEALDILATLDSPGFPIRVSFTPDGRHALVTNARAGELAVFDATARRRVATVPLLRDGAEYRDTLLGRDALPIGVVADRRRPRAYVAISGADEIAVVDTAAWKVVDYWRAGREPDGLGLVQRRVDAD